MRGYNSSRFPTNSLKLYAWSNIGFIGLFAFLMIIKAVAVYDLCVKRPISRPITPILFFFYFITAQTLRAAHLNIL